MYARPVWDFSFYGKEDLEEAIELFERLEELGIPAIPEEGLQEMRCEIFKR